MSKRRYDIDWIRVLVFDLLILYHVTLIFGPWDFHIKNNETFDWLRYPMLFLNQWRLPILFFISGLASKFVLDKRDTGQFIKVRLTRLLIPLVFGIFVIIPPQVYIEKFNNGVFSGSFPEFLTHIFDGIYPGGNFSWHHLWYLAYLIVFSLAAVPIFNTWKQTSKVVNYYRRKLEKNPYNIYLFLLILIIPELALEPFYPVTRALIGDWYALVHYFLVFLLGYLLVTIGEPFWRAIDKVKFTSLFLGIISFPLLVWLWDTYDINPLIPVVKVINFWTWMIVILAFAQKFLNSPSRFLAYRNEAVYPLYIMHQTVIIIVGYFLIELSMAWWLKLIIIATATFAVPSILFELLIKRVNVLRVLFGLKVKR
jgi:glucan biosynthesis protein C